jgi:hypothetical protein
LALRSNGSASGPADDGADCGPATATQCAPYNRPGSATEDCAAQRILCGYILHRRGDGNSE